MAIPAKNNDTVRGLNTVFSQYERDMATYLFNKYLVLDETKETKSQIAVRRQTFLQEFFPTRIEFIEADEELRKEIMDIRQATEEYANCPEDYPNGKTLSGYPDELRCKHIIYHRHRFSRCSQKVNKFLTNIHFCQSHIGEENPYFTEYTVQVNKILNADIKTPEDNDQVQNPA